MIDANHGWNASSKPQYLGLVLSLLLTAAAFWIVRHHDLTDFGTTLAIVGLGLAQVLFQLFFFLHLGLESKPHWGMITFLFTVMVILIVIGGSLWIMANLNYDLMPPMEKH